MQAPLPPMRRQPRGRRPLDQHGCKMVWDPYRGWISSTGEERVQVARPPPRPRGTQFVVHVAQPRVRAAAPPRDAAAETERCETDALAGDETDGKDCARDVDEDKSTGDVRDEPRHASRRHAEWVAAQHPDCPVYYLDDAGQLQRTGTAPRVPRPIEAIAWPTKRRRVLQSTTVHGPNAALLLEAGESECIPQWTLVGARGEGGRAPCPV